ncbi:hypothetical protein B6F30_15065 [Mycobacterium tuberculosis variant bovis]|nr:hypothetical protein B6F30_15065 [Mycobacterium tuberculosis variant bovis]
MTLRVVPEGLAAASAAVEALTARLAAAHAGAAPAITAVVAPAADPVSLQSAVGFSAFPPIETGMSPDDGQPGCVGRGGGRAAQATG